MRFAVYQHHNIVSRFAAVVVVKKKQRGARLLFVMASGRQVKRKNDGDGALQPDDILSLRFHFVPIDPPPRCDGANKRCDAPVTQEIVNLNGTISFNVCYEHALLFKDKCKNRWLPYVCEQMMCPKDAEFQTEIIGGIEGVLIRLCKTHKDEMTGACKSFQLK